MKKDLNEFEFLKGNLAVNGQAYVDERFSFEKEDSDSSQVHSGGTKAYSFPDRKRVKLRVTPLEPFPEGRIRGA